METLRRVIRLGVQDYWRNSWLSFSASVVVGVTLFIVAIFMLQASVIKQTTSSIQDKLDMAIYLSDGPSEEDVATFVQEVKVLPGVREIVYLNKEQVMAEWQGLNVDDRIKSQVTAQNNPLPRTIKVKTTDPAELDSVAATVGGLPFKEHIRNVSYRNNGPVIQSLNAQAKQSVRNGIVIGSIFGVIAIMFLYHTIRVMLKFRSDEIGVMKLVGATDAFVLGPFLVEGVLHGLLGGLIAFFGLWIYVTNGLSGGSTVLSGTSGLVSQGLADSFMAHRMAALAGLLGVGVIISLLCVWLSLRRHLIKVGGTA